ncbi:hypothetical protein JW898_01320 [Candidatus Woesearchaeota archaeon]|nr:hypothetical protein [Candidatus Woesearchaeota archaeon]
MAKKEAIVNIAMFMIFLIVTLPIHSSVVFGAVINSAQGTGSLGIPGFRARTDTTVVNLSVTVPEDPDLSSGQVKILEDPTVPFECQLVDGVTQTFSCRHEYPEILLPSTIGVMTFTVQVFDDAGAPISPPKQGSVTVDSLPPKVLDVNYSAKPGGAVEAAFDVKDFACEKPECSGRCAGVESVKFTVAGISVGHNSSFGTGCQHKGTLNLTGLTVGGEVVTKHICIEATDKLGQTGTQCSDVVIDTKPPFVSGIGLFDGNNKPLLYTNGQPIGGVRLKMNITEESKFFNPKNGAEHQVWVNASEMSERPEHKAVFGSRPAQCSDAPVAEDTYECIVDGLFLIATAPRTISIRIEAKDEHENILNETKSLSVTFDNTPPVATKIYSGFADDKGDFWVREDNNTIFMDIAETGAGMGNRYVFLDFSSFGVQDSPGSVANLAPNLCEAGWKCSWNWIRTGQPDSTRLSLAPGLGSKDDANNALQPVTGVMRVDRSRPEAVPGVSNMTGIGEGHDEMTLLTGGDMVTIHLYVKDYSGVKAAYANFSELIDGGDEAAQAECTENQIVPGEPMRMFDCVWSAGPINEGYLGPVANNAPSVYFRFEDNTNHTGEYEWKDIEILARENVTTASWDVGKITYSPELGLDRLSWKLQQPRMYYQVPFKAKGGRNPIPISFQIDKQSCTNLDYVNIDSLTNDISISLLGFPVYESNPSPPFTDVVEIRFNPDSVPEVEMVDERNRTTPLDAFDINCTIIITSIVTTGTPGAERALTLPEELNVSFHVPVYNNPLGQNIGNIKDQIKAMQDANDDFKWLTITRQVFDYAQAVCDLVKTLIQVDSAIAAVKDVFGAECGATGHTCSISEGLGDVMDNDDTIIPEFIKEVYQFCGLFISCRVSQQPRATCGSATGSERTWCNVQETYGRIASAYARALNSISTDFIQVNGTGFFNTASFDPKKSVFASAASLCLPGLISNLEKFRQLHCKKILCYKLDVAQGRPVWRCDQEYSYLVCTHLVGQAFAAIPLVQYISDVGGMIEGIFRNPYGLAGMVIDKLCAVVCSAGKSTTCTVCRGVTFIPAAITIIADLVESTGPRFKMAKFDMCEEALKDEPDYSNVKPPVPATGTSAAGD